MTAKNFKWQYYYLELIYFVFGYAAYTYGAAWLMTRDDPNFGPKFPFLLLVGELIVLSTTLTYLFVGLGVYVNLSDFSKGLYRLLFHPVATELLMLMPTRYLQRRYAVNDPVRRTIPCLHAQLHVAIIGRALLLAMGSTTAIWVTSILVDVEQTLLRLTMKHRDKLVMRLFKGKEAANEIENQPVVISVNVLTDQLIENSGKKYL
jgi:hypothetical protein